MSFNIIFKILFIKLSLLTVVHSIDCTTLSSCDTQCSDEGHFTDADTSKCKKPTLSDCYNKTGFSLCDNVSKFCITDFGFTNSSSDCIFPTDCDSNSVGCSESCKAIAFTGTSDCKP